MNQLEVFKLPLFNKNNPFCYLINNPEDNFRIKISFQAIDQNIKIARGDSLLKTIEDTKQFYYEGDELRLKLPKARIDINTYEYGLDSCEFKIIRYILNDVSIMIFMKKIDNKTVNTSIQYVGNYLNIEEFIKKSGWF